MKIVGNTVGTSLPKPDLRQTDPRKGDFVKGKDEISEIVNDALAQAKASGEFKGDPGEPGQPGADGKDYMLTPADKTEIAEMAAELVDVPDVDLSGYAKTEDIPTDEHINGLASELMKGVPKVPTATVGQTIKVKSVDDNGVPTAWEAVDFPSVPTKVSQLANDSGFQTESEVTAIVEEAIADIDIPSGGGGSGGGMELELIHDIVVEESVNGMNLDMRKNGKPVYWRYLEFVFVGVFDSPTGKTGSADLQIAKGYNGAEWQEWNVKVTGVFNSATNSVPTTFAYHREKTAESFTFAMTSRNHSWLNGVAVSEQNGVAMTDYEYIRLYFPGGSTDYNIGAGTKIKIWGIEG